MKLCRYAKHGMNSSRKPIPRNTRLVLAACVAAILVLIGAQQLLAPAEPKELNLSQLETAVRTGGVLKATLGNRTNDITGTLKSGQKFRSVVPPEFADEMTTLLLSEKVKTTADNEDGFNLGSFVADYLPLLAIVGIFAYFATQMQGGGKAAKFGRARTRRNRDSPDVTFADVAGADEAVAELGEIKDFLADPGRFAALGAKIPRGVLLVGPPGTGKTLLAKAVAGEAGVPFFTISGSDFVEMFVGVGAARVRDLFKQAKAEAPAIVFVDEIDAVGRHRGAGTGGGHDEREQTLNQLLVEMDGFDSTTGVTLMAATNRPDILDPALLRPGRFDRQILVDAPDLRGREAILAVHARNKPLSPAVDLSVVARRTPGFTGADLANVINEAALMCGRRRGSTIEVSDMNEAIDRVIAGPERKSRVMTDKEKSVTAYHEGGYTLVGHSLVHSDPIHKVSIVARWSALGWTMSLPLEDRHTHTRAELLARLAMLFGGRAAEEIVFGEITTGAYDDIKQATRLARSMVTEFGMSEKIGPQRLKGLDEESFLSREGGTRGDLSNEVAAVVDSEVKALLDQAEETARRIITDQRSVLDSLAAALIERETLDESDLALLLPQPGMAVQ